MRRPVLLYNFLFSFLYSKRYKWKLNSLIRSGTASPIWETDFPVSGGIFDIDLKARRLEELNREIENPDLWNDPKHAEQVSKEKKLLEDTVGTYRQLEAGIRDAGELFEMSREEEDWDAVASVGEDVKSIEKKVEQLEFKRMFNNPMDSSNCYLEIQAGAGGTEAQDWASMLERMYLKYTESKGFSVKLTSETAGDVAGIKNCSIYIQGDWAYGTLRTETGIHRLVRKSPFDSNARRHTSFASVYVYPEVDDSIEIEINPADLRIDVYRASGAGGQHVNKTSSAVRLIHKPTGIVVASQQERSQFQNKDNCMKMLRAKLLELKAQQHAEKISDIKGVQMKIEWGSQIRSYVFMPYQMVKDTRTGYETGNIDNVMDGDLDGFLNAYLTQLATGELKK